MACWSAPSMVVQEFDTKGLGAVGMVLVKISASCRNALSCSFSTFSKGVLGCGFCRALVRSRAASMAVWTEDVVGME